MALIFSKIVPDCANANKGMDYFLLVLLYVIFSTAIYIAKGYRKVNVKQTFFLSGTLK